MTVLGNPKVISESWCTMERSTRITLTRAMVAELLKDAEQHRITQNEPGQDDDTWQMTAGKLKEIEWQLMRALPTHDDDEVGPGSAFAKSRDRLGRAFHHGWVYGFTRVVDEICQLVGA